MPDGSTWPATAVLTDEDRRTIKAAAELRPEQDGNALPKGTLLDEFEIIRVLGVGGFGIVYLALDRVLLRNVAIKEYLPGALASRDRSDRVTVRSSGRIETFALGLESFMNEARMLANFDHPSLVKVHRFWKANGTAYMAMQYYDGPTLKDVRGSMAAPPDEAWLRALLEPLLGALEVLHKESVYHRDISPDNILLLADGRPVLLDFGSARRVISNSTQALTAILKPNFAPLEQYGDEAGMPQGAWTDLYALGATLHHSVTGKVPMPAVMRSIHDDLTRMDGSPMLAPGDHRLPAIIDWMLALAPQDRPQTVAAVRQALGGEIEVPVRKGATGVAPNAADKPAPAAPKKRRGMIAIGAAAAVAALVIVGVVMQPSRAPDEPAHAAVVVANPSTAPAPTPAPVPIAAAPAEEIAVAAATPASAASASASVAVNEAAAKRDTAPKLAPSARTPAARVATKATEVQGPAAAAAPKPAAEPTQVAAVPTPAAPVERRPTEACAASNFLMRATCIRRECQAPKWHAEPACIESNAAAEAQQRRGQS